MIYFDIIVNSASLAADGAIRDFEVSFEEVRAIATVRRSAKITAYILLRGLSCVRGKRVFELTLYFILMRRCGYLLYWSCLHASI